MFDVQVPHIGNQNSRILLQTQNGSGDITRYPDVDYWLNSPYLSPMKIQIINGPNLNLLGVREEDIYGSRDFENYLEELKRHFPLAELHYFQSNVEGELINKLHETGFSYGGIVLNAGAYTHTSIAIHDAIGAIKTPVVEVHISNIYAREEFRHKSLITSKCVGLISGFGLESYAMAIHYLLKKKLS
jgi:3-dehydroquinate dehydratase-2